MPSSTARRSRSTFVGAGRPTSTYFTRMRSRYSRAVEFAIPSWAATALSGRPDAYRCSTSRSRRPSWAFAMSLSASIAVAHSRLLSTSPRATVSIAFITVVVGEDLGMTPAAPAASASRTLATRSAMLWTSTAAPVACARLTLSVTLEPSPRERSRTTTSHSCEPSCRTKSSTVAAATTTS